MAIALNSNNMKKASELADSINSKDGKKVKLIRKEQGLLERTETEKVILAEDNRQVLFG